MNFLEKLDKMMADKGINKRQLSHGTKIPYTTILSFYDVEKGYKNVKLSTLRALADFFGCSLDYIADDSVQVDVIDRVDEQELVRLYRNADPRIQRAVDSLLKGE